MGPDLSAKREAKGTLRAAVALHGHMELAALQPAPGVFQTSSGAMRGRCKASPAQLNQLQPSTAQLNQLQASSQWIGHQCDSTSGQPDWEH